MRVLISVFAAIALAGCSSGQGLDGFDEGSQKLASIQSKAKSVAMVAASGRLVASDRSDVEEASEEMRQISASVEKLAMGEQVELKKLNKAVADGIESIGNDRAARIASAAWSILRERLGDLVQRALNEMGERRSQVIRRIVIGAVDGVMAVTRPYVEDE